MILFAKKPNSQQLGYKFLFSKKKIPNPKSPTATLQSPLTTNKNSQCGIKQE
jgi:hypothetical protein